MAEISLLEEALYDFMQSEIEARRSYKVLDLEDMLEHTPFDIPEHRNLAIPWMNARGILPPTVGDLDLDSGAVYKIEAPFEVRCSLYNVLKSFYQRGWVGQGEKLSLTIRQDLVQIFRLHRRISFFPRDV